LTCSGPSGGGWPSPAGVEPLRGTDSRNRQRRQREKEREEQAAQRGLVSVPVDIEKTAEALTAKAERGDVQAARTLLEWGRAFAQERIEGDRLTLFLRSLTPEQRAIAEGWLDESPAQD
jgi:hypothetical protein